MRRLILILLAALMLSSCRNTNHRLTPDEVQACDIGYSNYGKEVGNCASEFNLPPEYMMALIMLECSGDKNPASRYEPHIFRRLSEVRNGRRKSYEGITPGDLKDCSDDALKNLSRSWGPFQIMGFKSIHLGIQVKELRGTVGKGEIYWGAKWIHDTYGSYLSKGDFESAFRIHNTGSPNGKTHHKNYVSNGLRYAEYFKARYW